MERRERKTIPGSCDHAWTNGWTRSRPVKTVALGRLRHSVTPRALDQGLKVTIVPVKRLFTQLKLPKTAGPTISTTTCYDLILDGSGTGSQRRLLYQLPGSVPGSPTA
ncbi:hypothetical protein ElyMa_005818900 [Elysia marginata]|uniref:Uncharacterized protein n=1 Tax=Elysia marginata TaxID=1093978 RepID=A0AAV4FWR2_9GAST|nr:hypothetical protein ElyMa_005818900 [Elysia marginata]